MSKKFSWLLSITAIVGFIATGCLDDGGETEASGELPQSDSTVMAPNAKGDGVQYPETFEEFLDYVYCESDGGMCVVDGDTPIPPSMSALRDFYDQHVDRDRDVGRHQQGLAVNWNEQGPDLWDREQRHDLSFCISDDFGHYKEQVVEATVGATEAWEEVADVTFPYRHDQDHRCNLHNDEVLFPVLPSFDNPPYAGRAFFPSYIDLTVDDFDGIDDAEELPNPDVRINMLVLTGEDDEIDVYNDDKLYGLMLHELGHVLGFRHEHTRRNYDDERMFYFCFEDLNFRPGTQYDNRSVMHYPECFGENERPYVLSEIDKLGAEYFYPSDDRHTKARCGDDELHEDGRVNEDCEPVANQIVGWLSKYATEELLVEWMGFSEDHAELIINESLIRPFEDFDDLRDRAKMNEEDIRYVYAYLFDWGRCPSGEVDEDGWVKSSCYPVVNGILALVNNAAEQELREGVGLDSEVVDELILARQHREFASYDALVSLNSVDQPAVYSMYEYLYDDQ